MDLLSAANKMLGSSVSPILPTGSGSFTSECLLQRRRVKKPVRLVQDLALWVLLSHMLALAVHLVCSDSAEGHKYG